MRRFFAIGSNLFAMLFSVVLSASCERSPPPSPPRSDDVEEDGELMAERIAENRRQIVTDWEQRRSNGKVEFNHFARALRSWSKVT